MRSHLRILGAQLALQRHIARRRHLPHGTDRRQTELILGPTRLPVVIARPPQPYGWVIWPRVGSDQRATTLGARLIRAGLATLQLEMPAPATRDLDLAAKQLLAATEWLWRQPEATKRQPVGLLGACEFAPAVLLAAAELGQRASAVVVADGLYSALDPVRLAELSAPTRLVVAGEEEPGIRGAAQVQRRLTCPSEVIRVPDPTGLWGPTAEQALGALMAEWYTRHAAVVHEGSTRQRRALAARLLASQMAALGLLLALSPIATQPVRTMAAEGSAADGPAVKIGAHRAPNSVLARPMLFPATFELSSLNGTNGFTLYGVDPGDWSGMAVSDAGDVNGDGVADLIIGAHNADPHGSASGESYVVFGKTSGFSSVLELSSLDGSNGFVAYGIDQDDHSGHAVGAAGDINGDGIDDVIIGAEQADPNGSLSGESYVVFGKTSGFSSAIELSSLNGSNGFVAYGIDPGDFSGHSVGAAGDVNGDGVDDVVIGADEADPHGSSSGEAYVVFGKTSGFSSVIELSSLDGSIGFAVHGIDTGDVCGSSVSGAGDVDDDGIDDVIISAMRADAHGNDSGESYVVFGTTSGFSSVIDLSSLNGSNGFTVNGETSGDQTGSSVSNAGDVNGDGIGDLVIGARQASPHNNNCGAAYIVFGNPSGFSSSLDLSSLNGANGFALHGVDDHARTGESVSSAGDVNGDGIDDVIIGAHGADPPKRQSAGKSYVVYGTTSGFSSLLELSSLNGSNGFVAYGIDPGDVSGWAVSSAGDVNADGGDDIVIGAIADPNGRGMAGETYVVFGETPIPPTPTATPTPSRTPTATNTSTPTITPTASYTPSPTRTPTTTPLPTDTLTATPSQTPIASSTPSPTPTDTATVTPSHTPTPSPQPTDTPTPPPTATPTATPTDTTTATSTPTDVPTVTPTPTTEPGDCNADSGVNAGDISALILEIFDGDGSAAGDAPGGTFAGDPVGCDANSDTSINAGDLSCTILIIFNGQGACGL